MAKRILVVDDDFDDLQNVKKILEKEKYSVEIATNGAQALDKMEDDDFDAMLVDIKMPTLSGYDLLRLTRERLNGKMKIIYISIVPKKSVDMTNANGFVQKPVNAKTLIAEVKKVLK
jgi:DNA-binding response OmpR family regulator